LHFRCPNEQCEPILDIYASRDFHWYKERHKPLRFDPSNRSLKFRESTGTPSPKAGVALGVWGFTPSRFPTLPGVLDVTPGLPFGPHPCNPFALVASPKLGLRHKWILESLKRDCRGQNPYPWGVIYIIGNLLKLRCLKWAHIAHLNICNTNYGQKQGRKSNWQFDSWPLKVRNLPDSFAFRKRAAYCWKALDKGYNFALDLIAIEGLHRKLCALKVARVLVVGISGLPLENLGTKSHLDVAPVDRCRVYYKGEGDGFPQVRAVVSLVCSNCSWLVLAPKVLQLCINHFVLVLCRSVRVSEACHFFLVSSWSSNTPLYPPIVLRVRERAPTPYLPLFSVWDSPLNPSRSWECINEALHLELVLHKISKILSLVNVSCQNNTTTFGFLTHIL
jgi:hypothetical protein